MPTFTLSPGAGNIARARVFSVPFQIAQTSFTVPDVPSANRGYNNINQFLVTNIGIRAGGESHSNADARAKIFRSGGVLLAYSTLEDLPNVGTAIPSSEVNFSFPGSGSSEAILTGGVGYRFGMLGVNQANVSFARQVNSYNIDLQISGVSASSDFSANQTRPADFTNQAIMGTVTYIYAPSAPNTPSLSGVSTSSISISYGSLTGDNGGSAVTSYRVEYKPASSSTWELVATTASTSLTVSGLQSGTSYNFRVAAINAATTVFGNWSAYSGTLTASTEASAPVWTDNTLAGFSFNIPYSDSVSAINADFYAVSAGSLPSGISLSASGIVSGTPTAAQENYSFTISAYNSSNGLSVSQSFSGTVGGSDQPIKVYVGTSYPGNLNGWINGTVRVFDGTDWVTPIIKVYNGVSWVTPAS